MQVPSTAATKDIPFVEVADASISPDPEDADAKMETKSSAGDSIAEDMSVSTSTGSLEDVGSEASNEKPPSDNNHSMRASAASSADQQAATSAAAADSTPIDETSSCPPMEPSAEPSAGPSAADEDDAAAAAAIAAAEGSDPARPNTSISTTCADAAQTSLPTFPALPSAGDAGAAGVSSSHSASSAPESAAENAKAGQHQQPPQAPPSPSIAVAKRPKPGVAASSSKLRAANMPNNPNRSVGDSSSTATTNAATANGTPLRRGKWTVEEEEYAAMVIQMFNAGYLPAPAGT